MHANLSFFRKEIINPKSYLSQWQENETTQPNKKNFYYCLCKQKIFMNKNSRILFLRNWLYSLSVLVFDAGSFFQETSLNYVLGPWWLWSKWKIIQNFKESLLFLNHHFLIKTKKLWIWWWSYNKIMLIDRFFCKNSPCCNRLHVKIYMYIIFQNILI